MHTTQTQNAQRAEDHIVRQNARAPRRHFVPPSQEVTNTPRDVIIDRSIREQSGAVVEVGRPATQDAVQPVAYLRPRAPIAGDQHLVHLPP